MLAVLLAAVIFACAACAQSPSEEQNNINEETEQQETIEIDRLKRQVDSARNIALIRSCEFLENSRQSYVEESLKEKGDSTLQMSTVPPYIIKIDTAE